MMTPEIYRADPCGTSSLSFQKTNSYPIPAGIRIFRDEEFTGVPDGYTDTVYFKMIHFLDGLSPLPVPHGFSPVILGLEEYAVHISACYGEERVSPDDLSRYQQNQDLRTALRENNTGIIAASGIAELDPGIGEGSLEWIQVSPEYRRRSLGSFIVTELLIRMKGKADFVTVSGRMDDPSHPFVLYRHCGFRDPVLWHILRKA